MAQSRTKEGIEYLLERAKAFKMSADQQAEQRRSFAYGNAAFENSLITREMVAEEDEKLDLDHAK